MRSLTFALLGLVAAGAAACGPAPKSAPAAEAGPKPDFAGSYAASCRDVVTLANGYITAACANGAGDWTQTTLKAAACQGDIGNNAGTLVCNGATATPGDTPPPEPAPTAAAAPGA